KFAPYCGVLRAGFWAWPDGRRGPPRKSADGTGSWARRPGRIASTRGAMVTQALAVVWREIWVSEPTRLGAAPGPTRSLASPGSRPPQGYCPPPPLGPHGAAG